MMWWDCPDASVATKSKATRSTVATWGHEPSGAALKCVWTVGSPTGLTTGVAGQLAATDFSSDRAWAPPAGVEYRTASVLSTSVPCASAAATCRRAVRSDSLGNVPLHRSRVAPPATWVPPSMGATISLGPTSACRRTRPESTDAAGSEGTAGGVEPGPGAVGVAAGCEALVVGAGVLCLGRSAPPTIPMTNPRSTSRTTSVRPRGGQNGRRSVAGGATSGGPEKDSGSATAGPHQSGGGGPPPGTPAVGGGQAAPSCCWCPGSPVAPGPASSGKAWAVQLWPSQNLRWPLTQGSGYQPGEAWMPPDPPARSLAMSAILRPPPGSHLRVP